jgi:hypothetical protein
MVLVAVQPSNELLLWMNRWGRVILENAVVGIRGVGVVVALGETMRTLNHPFMMSLAEICLVGIVLSIVIIILVFSLFFSSLQSGARTEPYLPLLLRISDHVIAV